ncbi:MAG: DUF3696 domain-containing protein [Magnetococcales bacterium]|nr:DUF3696 domain-containing protein [Magnetococcales bacterium]
MIQSIRLTNFKCFESVSIPLAGLTLLTGLNGTGKSSIIQGLLLLRQTYYLNMTNQMSGSETLSIHGDLVGFPNAKPILFDNSEASEFGICITDKNDIDILKLISNVANDSGNISTKSITKTADTFSENLFTHRFQYLQTERLAPQMAYAMSEFHVRQLQRLGSRGEFTAHFLDVFGKTEINSSLNHEKARSGQLIHQAAAWLGEISPGIDIHIAPHTNVNAVVLEYSFATSLGRSRNYLPTNVGFGITYTLPIIVAILAAQPGDMLILENPEAHLHPQGQVRMAELVARAARAGIQIILETHSDHIINGVRVAVRQGKCAPGDVSIHYFSKKEAEDGRIYSDFVSPIIDKNGRITPWPEGFFDEWEKSLEALF